jgi:hypothetical protein
VEIAAALGVGVGELAGMAAGDAAVALALDRAEAAALAWWAALPREAAAVGARFNWGAWRGATAWRIGERVAAPVARGRGPVAPVRPRARYELPCNRTSVLLPNGQCPQCGKIHRGRRRPWEPGDPEAWKPGARRAAARAAAAAAGMDDNDDD